MASFSPYIIQIYTRKLKTLLPLHAASSGAWLCTRRHPLPQARRLRRSEHPARRGHVRGQRTGAAHRSRHRAVRQPMRKRVSACLSGGQTRRNTMQTKRQAPQTPADAPFSGHISYSGRSILRVRTKSLSADALQKACRSEGQAFRLSAVTHPPAAPKRKKSEPCMQAQLQKQVNVTGAGMVCPFSFPDPPHPFPISEAFCRRFCSLYTMLRPRRKSCMPIRLKTGRIPADAVCVRRGSDTLSVFLSVIMCRWLPQLPPSDGGSHAGCPPGDMSGQSSAQADGWTDRWRRPRPSASAVVPGSSSHRTG